ncbi:hypothetical protein ABTW95_21905 [Spirillospora sp. NPDC127506]
MAAAPPAQTRAPAAPPPGRRLTAAAISGGLTVYFGVGLLQMIWERLHGRDPFPPGGGLDLPEAFFWVAVPAYLAWGAGMAAAARGYARRTRRPCRACGR